jgi:hypothetical protein
MGDSCFKIKQSLNAGEGLKLTYNIRLESQRHFLKPGQEVWTGHFKKLMNSTANLQKKVI